MCVEVYQLYKYRRLEPGRKSLAPHPLKYQSVERGVSDAVLPFQITALLGKLVHQIGKVSGRGGFVQFRSGERVGDSRESRINGPLPVFQIAISRVHIGKVMHLVRTLRSRLCPATLRAEHCQENRQSRPNGQSCVSSRRSWVPRSSRRMLPEGLGVPAQSTLWEGGNDGSSATVSS